MKKTILVAALLVSGFLFQTANAQLRVRLNINIGSQPAWGPVGYDHVEYYYMPDIDAYYYVPNHQYIYLQRGRWVFTTSLPARFNSYDFNTGYKVVINEPTPYYHADRYRARYASYKGNHSQDVIRNSHDPRYFEIKDHPEHSKWRGNGNNGNNGIRNNGNNGKPRNNGHH